MELTDVSVGHRLEPVSLTARRGEILGIFSLPGQGQRELLLALAGDRPHTGTIEVGGQAFRPRSRRRGGPWCRTGPGRPSRGGAVPRAQHANERDGRLTGPCAQLFVCSTPVRSVGWHSARPSRWGSRPSRCGTAFQTLSGGNQQKAILGRALLEEPEVLILFRLNSRRRRRYQGRDLPTCDGACRRRDDSDLLSSDIAETSHFCDRIAVVSDGRIVATVDRSDATEEELLRLALGGAVTPPPAASVVTPAAVEGPVR